MTSQKHSAQLPSSGCATGDHFGAVVYCSQLNILCRLCSRLSSTRIFVQFNYMYVSYMSRIRGGTVIRASAGGRKDRPSEVLRSCPSTIERVMTGY